VPWREDATDEDLGRLLRLAVGIVREEAGAEAGDAAVQVEIVVRVRG
jgi:hypothetical protein